MNIKSILKTKLSTSALNSAHKKYMPCKVFILRLIVFLSFAAFTAFFIYFTFFNFFHQANSVASAQISTQISNFSHAFVSIEQNLDSVVRSDLRKIASAMEAHFNDLEDSVFVPASSHAKQYVDTSALRY